MLKAEFSKLKTEAQAIIEKAKSETRPLSAEEKADYDQKFARMTEIKATIGSEKALAALEIEADDEVKNVVTQSFSNSKKESNKMETVKHNELEAFRNFGRSGSKSYEQFALTSAGNTAVLMPKNVPGLSVIRPSYNAFRRGFAALGVSTFVTDSTENMTLPVWADTSNVANTTNEGATSGVNTDPTYSASVSLNLTEYHSEAIRFSDKVVAAQSFDITQYVYPALLSRIERKEDAVWAADVIANGSVGKTTASTTAVTLSELMDWDESMGAAYDGVPKFVLLSSAARLAIRKLAETTNKPFFGVEGGLEYLFGKPVFVSANLEAMTAGKVIGALVSVDGAIIRDTTANKFTRYENESAYPAQVGFEAFGWSAFGYNASSIKTLKTAAT